MAIPKITGAQRDFSAGEVDPELKRADEHPARQRGSRQMSNWRILHSGSFRNRPGRSALFPLSSGDVRTEEVQMSSGNIFKLVFGANKLKVVNSSGSVVQTFTTQGNGASLPWVIASDIQTIVYAIIGLNIYITFGHSMRPQVVTWDGVSTWSIADYTEQLNGSQKRTLFYRITQQGITAQPSATAGNITVTFSSPIVVSGMNGTRILYCGRQILLGTVSSSTVINATVIEPLPPSQTLTLTGTVGSFNIGDEVEGSVSGALGIVTSTPSQQTITFTSSVPYHLGDAVTGGTSGATGVVLSIVVGQGGGTTVVVSLSTSTAFQAGESITSSHGSATSSSVTGANLIVQLIPSNGIVNVFTTSDKVVGPSGSSGISGVSTGSPQPVTDWDDEVINSLQGYPGSVFTDQFRLGFCDFPTLPNFIAWSAVNDANDIYVGALATSAIFVPAPDKVRVRYVIPGPESSEFVMCDKKVYYIPIDPSNPLTPSTVSFQILSGDGCHGVQPRLTQELIIYVTAGGNSVMAITAPGMTNRPFNTKFISKFHNHLFSSIIALACPTSDGTFTERYIYALNSNGSIVVGKYTEKDIEQDSIVGWAPTTGAASVSWISALFSDVIFTSSYFGVPICEILDDTQYLDANLFVNNLPSAFSPPGGKGPLWWIPSHTVSLIDQGYRNMGTYQIDANGFIIPQNNGGENLSASTLVAGQPWTSTFEPFTPDANPGTSVHQRMFKRRVSRMAVYVINSTGFLLARLFSGPLTPTSPALGTIMNQRRWTAWNQGDNSTLPPPLREFAARSRPVGRSFDARVALIKDTPGPLEVAEVGLEASI